MSNKSFHQPRAMPALARKTRRWSGDGGPPCSSAATCNLESTDCALRRDLSEWRCNWPYPVIDGCSTCVTHRRQDAGGLSHNMRLIVESIKPQSQEEMLLTGMQELGRISRLI
ncbi:unnamed protein product [Pleuronectes platessa]|uniref:Uncharacterized protein n=1 Tax=Pleuronectes platessa TaxID=8262 RepID=A0A9N7VFD9_PLEPL|nr:unnamed protein product [Pleuronectes platessa]